jgi:hypothetical protein
MPVRRTDVRALVVVAAASGVYDILLGAALLGGRELLQSLFQLPAPAPPIHADLNGIFLLAVGIGYVLPCRRPDLYRGYLWVMGPFLKGTGSLVFVVDHFVRHSPPAFLVFAVADGTLALLTLWALMKTRAGLKPSSD